MKIGDLVTGYHVGIHKIEKIVRRFYKDEGEIPSHLRGSKVVGDEYGALVTYVRVLSDDGKVSTNKKRNACDMAFCKPVKELVEKKTRDLKNLKQQLKHIKKQNETQIIKKDSSKV